MRYIVYIFLLFPITVAAQTYKYIGIEDGLSNRRIFNIKKDKQGYMWFLTNEGMDRYNGKNVKHYKLTKENSAFNVQISPGWLYTDPQTGLWVIGKKGGIFKYDILDDQFKPTCSSTEVSETISYGYMDHARNIWLCGKDTIVLYNVYSERIVQLRNIFHSNITSIEQIDDNHFFIATETGISYTKLENGLLEVIPVEALNDLHVQVSALYFHQLHKRLFIGSFEKGIFVYDMHTRELIRSASDLSDVNITRICPLNDSELIISTEGMGVYKIDVKTCDVEHYIVANYKSYNEMDGNNINDIYVDNDERIWLANYPTGVTVIDYRYKNYRWMKHAMGNVQSLVNDQVHAVIEDSDGDLWFGTSNGISLYSYKTGTWHSFLSFYDHQLKDKNHIFITLCEVSPGIIWAGGYTSGIYRINKATLSVDYFSPYLFSHINMRPDKYIRTIVKDSKGYVWSGGYYNLKCFDLKTNNFRLYPGVNSITAIAEKDADHLWIGSSSGLYLLNRNSGELQYIDMNVGTSYINTFYQADNGLLYIGTNGSGVLVYNAKKKTFDHYFTDNSALVSNRIFTILPEVNGQIMMSTENGVTCFYTNDKIFRNWTRGEGLIPAYFNASSGTVRRNNSFVFGSTEGVIEIPEKVKFPHYIYSKMILSDFQISYQPIYPGSKNSPLKKSIDETKVLKLDHDQNTFSLNVSTINYDSPGSAIYTWKLEGFYNQWTQPGSSDQIRYTNVPPGNYTLHIRAISREEHNIVFEERTIKITIAEPLWLSWWAVSCYLLLIGGATIFVIRAMNLRKLQRISDEKTQFFINTAHDIRTPLTLIKTPLEEMLEDKKLPEKVTIYTHTALKNVDVLMRLTNNLMNFERADVYSSILHISEYELNAYINGIYNSFTQYASVRNIEFTYESSFSYLNVWFDKEKMDSILKNILSNALKYTPDNGNVSVSVSDNKKAWKVVIKDTGIGIPTKERNKLFKLYFRATNAINSKVAGSGIGLVLVGRLIRLHGGKINVDSVEQQGTTIKIVFPKDTKHFRNARQIAPSDINEPSDDLITSGSPNLEVNSPNSLDPHRILIAEDNDELRAYLANSLSSIYSVQACANGKEALIITKEFWPDLILSDIMMPEMDGNELCKIIKSDVSTSHIPVVLITALVEENSILNGLQIGADDYIEKPFSLKLLKASIANILANRELLRSKYANMEADSDILMPTMRATSSIDWKFISEVRTFVMENIDNTDLKVDALSKKLGMSRTNFYNKLKALTGLAPQEFIQTNRLNRAKELLREGKHNVTEISELCGYSTAKYFRQVFKNENNMTPREYAKSKGNVHIVDDNDTSDSGNTKE